MRIIIYVLCNNCGNKFYSLSQVTISYWLHETKLSAHVIIPNAVFSVKDDPTMLVSVTTD